MPSDKLTVNKSSAFLMKYIDLTNGCFDWFQYQQISLGFEFEISSEPICYSFLLKEPLGQRHMVLWFDWLSFMSRWLLR